MLFDKVLERWCGVVEAGPFAVVEGYTKKTYARVSVSINIINCKESLFTFHNFTVGCLHMTSAALYS
jgi:hypothetical protein